MDGDPWDKLHLWKKQYEEKYGSKQGMDFEGFFERPKENSLPNLKDIIAYSTIVTHTQSPFDIPNAPEFSAYLRRMTSGKLTLNGPFTYPLDPFSFENGERWHVLHNGAKIGEYKCHGQVIDGFRGLVTLHMEYSGKLPEQQKHMILRYSGKRRHDQNSEVPFP
jgi:hypothetical protein